jgi:hypothetical protein
MSESFTANRWAVLVGAAFIAAIAAIVAYNAGVSHGLVQSGQLAAHPDAFRHYGWYRPWGFGFVFPFLFFGFWLFVWRAIFWGGPWRRRRWYYDGPRDMSPMFDEWHRRAHERMNSGPAGTPDDENRSRR